MNMKKTLEDSTKDYVSQVDGGSLNSCSCSALLERRPWVLGPCVEYRRQGTGRRQTSDEDRRQGRDRPRTRDMGQDKDRSRTRDKVEDAR